MKPYSLSFRSNYLEVEYQEKNMRANLRTFGRNLALYGCIALIIALYSYFVSMWQLGLVGTSYVLVLPIVYRIAICGSEQFDYSCLAF